MVSVVTLGCAFDKPKECAQIFAFRRLKLRKLDTNAKGWATFGDDSGQDQAFDPNFSVCKRKYRFLRLPLMARVRRFPQNIRRGPFPKFPQYRQGCNCPVAT